MVMVTVVVWRVRRGLGGIRVGPGCDTGWPVVLCYQHRYDNPLLQIPTTSGGHILSSTRGHADFGPDSGHLPYGCSACMGHLCSAGHPECSRLTGRQPTQVILQHTSPPHPALPWRGCLYLIKVTCQPFFEWPSYIQDMVKPYTLARPLLSMAPTRSLR